MFKFRNGPVETQALPSIHVYHCGSTTLRNDALIEYEMIRRAREAERNLTQLLLLQHSSRKGSLLEFRVFEDLLATFNRTKRLNDHVESLIPLIKVIPCKEDNRTAADLEDEMLQRALIAKMQFEEAPETFEFSDDDMTSEDETDVSESEEEIRKNNNNSFKGSTESLNNNNSERKNSLTSLKSNLSKSDESVNTKRTFPFMNKPLQMFHLKKARSFSLKSGKDADSYILKRDKPKLVQYLTKTFH